MEILLAKNAGFCFGVNNAIKLAYEIADNVNSSENIYSLGSLIHNEQVVADLSSKGVKKVNHIDEIEENGYVIIRAHGVAPEVYRRLEEKNLKIIDATCPYVKRIQNLAAKKHEEGFSIILLGDPKHPEVVGIDGWCENKAFIINDIGDVDNLPDDLEKICLLSQSTMSKDRWNSIKEAINNKFRNVVIYDTICNATSNNQREAEEIAKKVDLMFVIGSKKSSNTQKLFEICKKYCLECYNIETSGDFPPVDISKYNKIGITAGSSTPDWIIKEVIHKMEEMNNKPMEEMNDQSSELSFKEAFEKSLVTLHSGEVIKGKIIGFNDNEVFVDMGYKSDGIIPMEEFTDEPDFSKDSLKVGQEIEAFIVRVNDGEGNVLLSKKKADALKSWDIIEEAYENKTPIKVKVIEVTNGGLIANAKGLRVFIPASQVGEKFVKDLSSYLMQTIEIRIIEFNKQKKKIVGSERVILTEKRNKLEADFWNNIEAGKTYNGVVKSITDFGVFVDLGGIDGLVHISELSWNRIKHPSEVLKVGDNIEVTVLEYDKEKKKISLTHKKPEDNPWYKAEEKYQVGNIVSGTVVRLVPFGAFVELEKGVDGLVHISQISNVRLAKPGDVLKVGQKVEAKIIESDIENKKISLSIKEVNPIDPEPKEAQPSAEEKVENKADNKADDKRENKSESNSEEELPTEHKEELDLKIGDLLKDYNNSN
ncbi:MAG TPA: bifunctional 4-hydroxy-3-methylbut-2-enyl diphosphate reductase/30S ribosomal protein S1 [Clostridiaceae bacterium]|nr:bifunctional 4-hydroxy-3-methylbut-2-enyl diphosphate reductase/30S ribosomal protein S1 [Clostridiaceae bacterium]